MMAIMAKDTDGVVTLTLTKVHTEDSKLDTADGAVTLPTGRAVVAPGGVGKEGEVVMRSGDRMFVLAPGVVEKEVEGAVVITFTRGAVVMGKEKDGVVSLSVVPESHTGESRTGDGVVTLPRGMVAKVEEARVLTLARGAAKVLEDGSLQIADDAFRPVASRGRTGSSAARRL